MSTRETSLMRNPAGSHSRTRWGAALVACVTLAGPLAAPAGAVVPRAHAAASAVPWHPVEPANTAIAVGPQSLGTTEVGSGTVGPYVALGGWVSDSAAGAPGSYTYVALQPTVWGLLTHLHKDGQALDAVDVYDVDGRLQTLVGGRLRPVVGAVRQESFVAESLVRTFGRAADRLVKAGCTMEQVSSLRLPAKRGLDQVVAAAGAAMAEIPGESPSPGAATTPPSVLVPKGPRLGPAEPTPAATQSLADCRPSPAELPVTGHRHGWLHNLWHRVTG